MVEPKHERGQMPSSAVPDPSGDEPFEPPTPVVLLQVDPAERGSGAVHEQLKQKAVAACADAEEP